MAALAARVQSALAVSINHRRVCLQVSSTSAWPSVIPRDRMPSGPTPIAESRRIRPVCRAGPAGLRHQRPRPRTTLSGGRPTRGRGRAPHGEAGRRAAALGQRRSFYSDRISIDDVIRHWLHRIDERSSPFFTASGVCAGCAGMRRMTRWQGDFVPTGAQP